MSFAPRLSFPNKLATPSRGHTAPRISKRSGPVCQTPGRNATCSSPAQPHFHAKRSCCNRVARSDALWVYSWQADHHLRGKHGAIRDRHGVHSVFVTQADGVLRTRRVHTVSLARHFLLSLVTSNPYLTRKKKKPGVCNLVGCACRDRRQKTRIRRPVATFACVVGLYLSVSREPDVNPSILKRLQLNQNKSTRLEPARGAASENQLGKHASAKHFLNSTNVFIQLPRSIGDVGALIKSRRLVVHWVFLTCKKNGKERSQLAFLTGKRHSF